MVTCGPPRLARPVAALALAAGALASTVAWGHGDDPKLRDRRPRVEAPTWRADIEGGGRPATPDAGAGDAGHLVAGSAAFPAANIVLHAWLPLAEFGPGAATGADCWGYVSPAGREYAIMTVRDAVAFVEVTDPGDPAIIASLEQPASIWHDVKTFGHHAYAVSEGGGGIRVFDLSQIDGGTVADLGNVLDGGIPQTHNVAVDEDAGFLYRCGGGTNGGLRIYSLADPAVPAFAGQWTLRYVHDAQVRTLAEGPFAGRTIAFCAAGFNGGSVETGLTILDVTDPAAVVELATLNYDDAAYAHQCWLSEDGQTLYFGDEVDELELGVPTLTRVFDVRDPANPREIGRFGNGRVAIDHNQYVLGDLIFQANYTSGLRIWEIGEDVADPREVAFIDTFPEDDRLSTNGAWNVYPFLPSGTLIVSDIERGLFLVSYDPAPLRIDAAGPLPGELVPPGGTSFTVSITGVDGGELEPGSAVLVVGAGGPDGSGEPITVPLMPAGGDQFIATIPPGACGEPLRYHVEATAIGGRLVSWPLGAPGPGSTLRGTYGDTTVVVFADDFETDAGWTYGLPGDTSLGGQWERAVPGGVSPSEPGEDNPAGEGTFCAVTGNSTDEEPFQFVRQGFVSLISPRFDATAGDAATISYARWLAGPPGDTFLEVAISADDGSTWTVVRDIPAPAFAPLWTPDTFRVDEFIEPSATMRLRVVCTAGTFGEAAIDDVVLRTVACAAAPCPADVDASGAVDVGDILAVLAAWGPCAACPADVDGSGVVDTADLLEVLAAYGPCD